MPATLPQIQKWREAHPMLHLDEAALAQAGPWPSLHVNDYIAYLQSKGADADMIEYVRDLGRETAWVYGNWKKQARDSVATEVLRDLLNNASAVGEGASHYAFVQRFIRDYAAANGIALSEGPVDPSWLAAAEQAEIAEAAAA